MPVRDRVPQAERLAAFLGRMAGLGDRRTSIATLSVYMVRVFSAGAVFLLHVLIARLLEPTAFGVFAFVWILTTVVAQLAAIGFNESVKRFLPGYIVTGDLESARGFITTAQVLPMLISIPLSVAAASGIWSLQDYLPSDYPLPVLIGLCAVPILALTHIQECLAVSRSHALRGLLPGYVLRPLLTGVIVVALVLGLELPGQAGLAVAALVLAATITLAFQTPLIYRALRGEIGPGARSYHLREWVTASFPLLLVQSFYVLSINLDILVISFYQSPAEVGLYFAVAKTVGLVAFMHQAVSLAAVRGLSEAYASEDKSGFHQLVIRARKRAFWPTALGSVFLVLIAPYFFEIFGPSFVAGAALVPVLIAGLLVQAASGPLQDILLVHGQQKSLAYIAAFSLVLNLLLNLALIPPYGLAGAAAASSIALVIRVLAMWIANKRTATH
ncbi:lipopolysaccharide biosynthesis protein [Coralliovum pocilloporae]|uniref:lipopolysaccharide biosynthesis protein n=1 Tax=Coralliovum pocilloporae TaxID=3066369 RepID=UPI003307420B